MMMTKVHIGDVIQVPRGADLSTKQAYAIRITGIYSRYTSAEGLTTLFVRGDRLRMDGTPTRRKGKTMTSFIQPKAVATAH